MIDSKVILREFRGQVNLTKTRTLCMYKLAKIIIVNENDKLIFPAFQGIAPIFEDLNDSQKLLFVDFAVCLSQNHFS